MTFSVALIENKMGSVLFFRKGQTLFWNRCQSPIVVAYAQKTSDW